MSVEQVSSGRAVLLPCLFSEKDGDRSAWDYRLSIDMRSSRGIRFHFYCDNPSPVAGFSLSLRSGNGWYTASFGPERKGRWTAVTIDRASTGIEGRPSGWGKIDTLRISAWRGGSGNAVCAIGNLGVADEAGTVAVVRAESVANAGMSDARSVCDYSGIVFRLSVRAGVPAVMASDLDLTAEYLRRMQVAILPYNPRIPDDVRGNLVSFVRAGGKVLSFYHPPQGELGDLLGIRAGDYLKEPERGFFSSIRPTADAVAGMPAVSEQASWNIIRAVPADDRCRVAAQWYDKNGRPTGEPAVLVSPHGVHMTHVLLPDDPQNKRNLLLSLVAAALPDVWRKAFFALRGTSVEEQTLKTLDEAALRKPQVRIFVEDAARAKRMADECAGERRFEEAVAHSSVAREASLLAYCCAQEPVEPEFRGIWCHSAFGPAGMSWDEAVSQLARNGFTAVFPNMLWAGTAYYESKVLPVAPEVGTLGDQLSQCLDACRKHKVQCHVWKVFWNTGGRASASFIEQMRREGRTQVSFSGRPADAWLCPSHPANQQMEIDALVEVVARYPVEGIHLDYIRYPGSDACYCQGCRKRFEEMLGFQVKNWPDDTRKDPFVRQSWLEFRRQNITKVVAELSRRVRQARPGVKVSAAVFPNWPVHRDTVGQDWKAWCDAGYLDFVCPMDYTAFGGLFEAQVESQKEWAGNVPVYPGIGLTVWPDRGDIVKLIDFIGVTRRLGTGGFMVFDYDASASRRYVPLCGLGVTKPR